MNIPGFTAEASLSETSRAYRNVAAFSFAASQNRVVPQAMRWRVITTVLEDGTICVGIEDEDAGISVPLGCY